MLDLDWESKVHSNIERNGIIALNDNEDAHVLETAIAGRVEAIITRNFDDFALKNSNDTQIITEKEHAIYSTAQHSLHIVQPKLMLKWLTNQQIPLIETFSRSVEEKIAPLSSVIN